MARWGLIPFWWKKPKPPGRTHNARAKEAATKPT
jgi:putative SOS response-associated peptidase YedK